MKKILVVFVALLIGIQLSCIPVNADSPIANEISIFIQEYSLVEPTWVNANVHSFERLYNIDDDLIGYLYRIYQNNVQQGYIIYLFEMGITEAKFTGVDKAIDIYGKVYYVVPSGFFSKKQLQENYDILVYNATIQTDLTGTGWGQDVTLIRYNPDGSELNYESVEDYFYINTSHVPNLSANVNSYYISMVSKVWIENVPSYLGQLVGMANVCAPTAGAMFIAYYDNELWNNLSTLEGGWWWQYFPLLHEDDEDLVNELVLQLSGYFRTCINMNGDLTDPTNCVGSSAEEVAFGLKNYLDDHNHSSYTGIKATMGVDYDDYTALIALGNPSVVQLAASSSYGSHSVIGIGFYSAYMSPSGLIIYDDQTHGEVWISYSIATYYEFLYYYG